LNILITNTSEEKLSSLDIDIIKHISGTYEVKEIVDMFSTFFYNKIIIDITAINNNKNIETFKALSEGVDADKIILYLPEGSEYCTSEFLSNLISVGIYNFTTNLEGIKYLIKNSNSYKDVAHIQKIESTGARPTDSATSAIVSNDKLTHLITVGIKNATSHAGATTLTYLLTKELSSIYGRDKVLGIEVDKDDFKYFNIKNLVSTGSNNLRQLISSATEAKIIIIDLNKFNDVSMCDKVLYLVEPSTLQLNKMIDRNKFVLDKLKNELVVLNKSLLSNKDLSDFENESGIRIIYNLPPLNDRIKNDVIYDFLVKIGLVSSKNDSNKSNKIFGLFRR